MSLPYPSRQYDQSYMSRLIAELERRELNTHRRNADVEIAGDQRLILSSPDGTRWSITVDNSGVISATAI